MRNETRQTHSMSQALSSTNRADRIFFKTHLNNLRRYQSERWLQVSSSQGDQRAAHNTRKKNFYYCFRRFSVTSSVYRCHTAVVGQSRLYRHFRFRLFARISIKIVFRKSRRKWNLTVSRLIAAPNVAAANVFVRARRQQTSDECFLAFFFSSTRVLFCFSSS